MKRRVSVRILRVLLVACTFLLVGGCATTQQPAFWEGRSWRRSRRPLPARQSKLWRGTRENVVAEIPTEQVTTILQASQKIQAAAGFRVDRHFISDAKEVNASATTNVKGDRVVVINLGIVKALGNDKDAWAGLLGHEIAHHVKGHGATRDGAKVGAYAGQAVATAVGFIPVGGPIASMPISSAAGTAAQMAVYGSYTRPQEEEADRLGLEWMIAAGYDASGMLRLMQILAKQSETSMPALLSTIQHRKNVERASKPSSPARCCHSPRRAARASHSHTERARATDPGVDPPQNPRRDRGDLFQVVRLGRRAWPMRELRTTAA